MVIFQDQIYTNAVTVPKVIFSRILIEFVFMRLHENVQDFAPHKIGWMNGSH